MDMDIFLMHFPGAGQGTAGAEAGCRRAAGWPWLCGVWGCMRQWGRQGSATRTKHRAPWKLHM